MRLSGYRQTWRFGRGRSQGILASSSILPEKSVATDEPHVELCKTSEQSAKLSGYEHEKIPSNAPKSGVRPLETTEVQAHILDFSIKSTSLRLIPR